MAKANSGSQLPVTQSALTTESAGKVAPTSQPSLGWAQASALLEAFPASFGLPFLHYEPQDLIGSKQRKALCKCKAAQNFNVFVVYYHPQVFPNPLSFLRVPLLLPPRLYICKPWDWRLFLEDPVLYQSDKQIPANPITIYYHINISPLLHLHFKRNFLQIKIL